MPSIPAIRTVPGCRIQTGQRHHGLDCPRNPVGPQRMRPPPRYGPVINRLFTNRRDRAFHRHTQPATRAARRRPTPAAGGLQYQGIRPAWTRLSVPTGFASASSTRATVAMQCRPGARSPVARAQQRQPARVCPGPQRRRGAATVVRRGLLHCHAEDDHGVDRRVDVQWLVTGSQLASRPAGRVRRTEELGIEHQAVRAADAGGPR